MFRHLNALINLLSGIYKFCPPAVENDADRILSVGFVVSKTIGCADKQYVLIIKILFFIFTNFKIYVTIAMLHNYTYNRVGIFFCHKVYANLAKAYTLRL